VVDRAPRWAIRKLTDTYLTLSLPEIGRAAGIEDVAEVRRIVVSMVRLCGLWPLLSGKIPLYSYAFEQIETGEIEASVDADGSVTFADDEPAAVSKAELDRALRVAQEQEKVLRKLEREIAKNKDYLQKVRIYLLAYFVERQ
jgi:COP9 signalosome complex subunit 3